MDAHDDDGEYDEDGEYDLSAWSRLSSVPPQTPHAEEMLCMDFEYPHPHPHNPHTGSAAINPMPTTTPAPHLRDGYSSIVSTLSNHATPSFPLTSTPTRAPSPSDLEAALTTHITELVSKHGCIRENQRCARQLRDYWIPTLPPALRGCDIDSVMAECRRIGKRLYLGTEERRMADVKWKNYCQASLRRREAEEEAAAAGGGITPVTTIHPPPPPPVTLTVAARQKFFPRQQQQQSQQQQQHPQPLPPQQPLPQHPQQQQLYVIMAPSPEILQNLNIVGVIHSYNVIQPEFS